MERQIVWNKGALKQLEVIYEYIKNDSSQNAEKVIEKIRIRINDLPIHPEIYPPDRFKTNNKRGNYRAFTIYNFRISYHIKGNKIIIIRIRHTGMSPLEY
ncbi:MAG: type II toxin-antitoxin system RelE/ParE family toxin [Chitinophagaceae bacterium]|nr:MAG: type II toxin-antitoxin system RelE/ParE family toxin [Chitinophagaceae bacterium]